MQVNSNLRFGLFLVCLIVPTAGSAGFLDDLLEKGKQFTGADTCRSYSEFTCAQLEASRYNTYFYFPDKKEVYVGESSTLSGCGSMAHSFARSKGLSRGDNWGYICCLIVNGSSCYEKHR